MDDSNVRDLPGRFFQLIALLSGAFLCAIMLLVAWAVFARYVLNNPVLGDQELVEIGMSLVVMMAMPFATISGAHIRVDILDQRLGNVGRWLGDLLSRCLGVYVIYLLINKTWDKMLDAYEYKDVTNMIEIPVWIAYAAISFGMGLVALILLAQVFKQLRNGIGEHD